MDLFNYSTTCESNKYFEITCRSYNYGGTCLPCVPCPKRNLHAWLIQECINAFVDCPNLCRIPSREWREDELANSSICTNLNPFTTAAITTRSPTTMEDITTDQKVMTTIGQLDTSTPGKDSNRIIKLWVQLLNIHTLCVQYAHAAANLNSGYSKYAKVARVHYFGTIALRISRAVLMRA